MSYSDRVHQTQRDYGVKETDIYCGYCHGRHKDEPELMKCRVRCEKIDLEDQFWLPEAVRGYRGFSIEEQLDGTLLPRGVKITWPSAEPPAAKCMPFADPLNTTHTKAPIATCMCGYYILKEMTVGSWEMEARVEGWGDVIEHENGYRVERVRILALRPGKLLHSRQMTDRVRQIAREFGVEYVDGDW